MKENCKGCIYMGTYCCTAVLNYCMFVHMYVDICVCVCHDCPALCLVGYMSRFIYDIDSYGSYLFQELYINR